MDKVRKFVHKGIEGGQEDIDAAQLLDDGIMVELRCSVMILFLPGKEQEIPSRHIGRLDEGDEFIGKRGRKKIAVSEVEGVAVVVKERIRMVDKMVQLLFAEGAAVDREHGRGVRCTMRVDDLRQPIFSCAESAFEEEWTMIILVVVDG